MAPPHEHNNARFNSSDDSPSYTDFEKVAESDPQIANERHKSPPIRRGILARARDRMQAWRRRAIHRAIDQPLDDRVRHLVPDWVYSPWGLSVVILISFAAIGFWAVLLYVVAF